MELKTILNGIEGLKARGDLNLNIENISQDSRKIIPGGMFIAIKGFEVDGHDYIKAAISNGAKVIMINEGATLKKSDINADTTIIMAPDTRKALAKIACNFYDNPSKKFKLIGVTGTKGKTTTTFMIKEILEKAGQKVGLIGTVANYIGSKCLGESERTTPDSMELQRIFSEMVDENVDTVVMEVSSQALKLNRVDGSDFDIGIFTNFSKDHISEKEHPDMDDYYNSKIKLFEMCKTGYINADDYKVSRLKAINTQCDIKTYGIDNTADLLAKDITVTNVSADFKVKVGMRNERIKVGIPGRFSVYNSLAAIFIANKYGIDAEKIKEALLEIKVPGRSELVPNKKELAIMIDYAHSPESLQNILNAVKNYTRGRVICVFGCGGNRDSSKRPIMGEIAGNTADFTIITSDNPRNEEPESIISQIEEGTKKTKGKYAVVVDRTEAIKQAIKMANKNDIIVLAGKGHETYQEINGEKKPYDERKIVKEIIG
ncbi:MAG: UDP-N-acetylmuramoyl-L-alanyl-D-glutamate--2,6-diaminopimelate ligase [Clostridiales bacterium]|nr:UDP-N-acetylmuramoyl-L-alanyl-D-glutamate--2,6-diaminopimelate ligase [Clostridiales bacterium]